MTLRRLLAGVSALAISMLPAAAQQQISPNIINNPSVFTSLTPSGNPAATLFPLLDAAPINGECPQFDSFGGFIPVVCPTGGGGGSGVVSAGLKNQIGVYPANGSTIVGEANSGAIGRTWAKDFGVVCDGTTDDTAHLQAAWTAAAAANQELYIGGIGTGVCKITQIVAPQPTAGETGNRAGLVGSGMGSTVLKSSTPCAIDFAPTGFGTNSDINTRNRDFSIIGTNISSAICLLGVTQMTFQNVFIGNFAIGAFAQDSIRITWIDCIWAGFTAEAIDAVFGTLTHPNSWTFINARVSFSAQFGFIFDHPTQLNIIGGDFENNTATAPSSGVIYIDGNPVDGTAGLNLSGGYFSVNGGGADVVIDNASGSENGVHTITGAEFDRHDAPRSVINNIFLANNGTGFTTLNVQGNGFQGFGYTASASNLYIAESNASSNNWLVNSGGNWFQPTTPSMVPAGSFWAETGWVQYSPTVSCSSGTLGSATVTGAFKRITQKTIVVRVAPSITTLGSCAGSLVVTLPFPSTGVGVGATRNTATNTAGTISTASAGTATLLNYDGTLGVGNGNSVWGELQYETTQ